MRNTEQTQRVRDGYSKALQSGDKEGAAERIREALVSGVPAGDIYLKVIVPAQIAVGEMWHQGKISVAEEHLATQISMSQMDVLRAAWERKPLLGKKAVISSVEGDSHIMGSRMVADFFHQDGWDIDYLGGDTPVADLLKFVMERSVDIVVLSLTLIDAAPALKRFIRELRQKPKRPQIIAGGLAFALLPELRESVQADAIVGDAREAVREARKLCGVEEPQVTLEQMLTNIGNRIQRLRKESGMSQQELASQAGIDRAYLSGVEHGRQNITLGAMLKLTDALGVPMDDFLAAAYRE